ncbi:hypothetical protein Asppvi_007779 [Aspergillus pseudoviridinutans]|uniref:HNH nuclease domain-containing protein n=1 Tax=Aspergillus pseudoviridinutans TaxID=1517512 RepID=A0A9P3BJG0_9EURO|nr:uncharacterized protein Asppvi_007779 [Aspergillus pseudoviridinutans]GIJ88851.1 hypothetical protein Asppvi_007779 [Aspergillus pseudoviridinutans]
MAHYRSMQPSRGTSYSDSSDPTTNVNHFVEMPGEVRATLNSYVPLDADDETVKLLRETFRYLPSDGRVNLAEDIIQAGAGNKLQQLAQSIVSGLLKPMMVAGAKKMEIPRLGIEECLANKTDGHESMRRARQLQEDALRRDGNKCVVSGHYDVLSEELYPDETTADLETAYIVPFALSKFNNEYEKQQIIAVWTNIFRYFPSVRSRLGFYYQNINSMVNVMTLSLPLHTQFRRFSLALEQETGSINQYRVKTFCGFATAHRAELPASGTIRMTGHDGFPLASPILLQVHCAVASILHATGEGAKIARVLRDYDATGGLASDGSTNVSQLLSLTKLALVPHARRFDGTGSTDD